MAREVECDVETPFGRGPVRATMDAGVIVLRGAVAVRMASVEITEARASVFGLAFVYRGELCRLKMPVLDALAWVPKLNRPKPPLRDQLGLEAGQGAAILGDVGAAVVAAVGPDLVAADQAAVLIARAEDAEAARAAAEAVRRLPARAPLWAVHHVAAAAAVAAEMRALGLADGKVAAVAPGVIAVRFMNKKAGPT